MRLLSNVGAALMPAGLFFAKTRNADEFKIPCVLQVVLHVCGISELPSVLSQTQLVRATNCLQKGAHAHVSWGGAVRHSILLACGHQIARMPLHNSSKQVAKQDLPFSRSAKREEKLTEAQSIAIAI